MKKLSTVLLVLVSMSFSTIAADLYEDSRSQINDTLAVKDKDIKEAIENCKKAEPFGVEDQICSLFHLLTSIPINHIEVMVEKRDTYIEYCESIESLAVKDQTCSLLTYLLALKPEHYDLLLATLGNRDSMIDYCELKGEKSPMQGDRVCTPYIFTSSDDWDPMEGEKVTLTSINLTFSTSIQQLFAFLLRI